MPLFTGGNPYSSTTGQVTIVAGDDYKAADGRAAKFTNGAGSWPDLTGAAVYFVGQNGNFPPQSPQTFFPGLASPPSNFPGALIAPVAGTVIHPTGASQEVDFDLPAASTAVRPCPTVTDLYAFAVYAVLSNGDVVTLLTGPLQVLGAA